ncbi:unnamed protein product, partial [Phaeothamnion confervicola]
MDGRTVGRRSVLLPDTPLRQRAVRARIAGAELREARRWHCKHHEDLLGTGVNVQQIHAVDGQADHGL